MTAFAPGGPLWFLSNASGTAGPGQLDASSAAVSPVAALEDIPQTQGGVDQARPQPKTGPYDGLACARAVAEQSYFGGGRMALNHHFFDQMGCIRLSAHYNM